MALLEADRGDLFTQTIDFTATPPVRTDNGLPTAPDLNLERTQDAPPGPRMSRKQMYETLLASQGAKCQGCIRVFDDPCYFDLDHNVPRSDSGLNHISNRILLCGPCNRLKSNTRILTGLRQANIKRGFMRCSKAYLVSIRKWTWPGQPLKHWRAQCCASLTYDRTSETNP